MSLEDGDGRQPSNVSRQAIQRRWRSRSKGNVNARCIEFTNVCQYVTDEWMDGWMDCCGFTSWDFKITNSDYIMPETV